jgi:hypothetical protein
MCLAVVAVELRLRTVKGAASAASRGMLGGGVLSTERQQQVHLEGLGIWLPLQHWFRCRQPGRRQRQHRCHHHERCDARVHAVICLCAPSTATLIAPRLQAECVFARQARTQPADPAPMWMHAYAPGWSSIKHAELGVLSIIVSGVPGGSCKTSMVAATSMCSAWRERAP